MNPYLRLRLWQETSLAIAGALILLVMHDHSIPQLFGPLLHYPVFASNLASLGFGVAASLAARPRWDGTLEATSRARSVAAERAIIVGVLVAVRVAIAGSQFLLGFGFSVIALFTVQSLLLMRAALALGRRFGLLVSMVLGLVLSFVPWIFGDQTILGDSLGGGVYWAVSATEVLLALGGLGFWIVSGGRR